MELTAWQKICHRILGKFFKKRARNDAKLSDDLVKGNMPIMPEVYMAQLFVTTVTVTIICAILLVAVFMPNIGLIDWYESRPDESTAMACYEWEYWNSDLVDETLESRGCPYFKYMEFPFFAKILIPVILGFVVPFGTYKYLKGSAARAASRKRGSLGKVSSLRSVVYSCNGCCERNTSQNFQIISIEWRYLRRNRL